LKKYLIPTLLYPILLLSFVVCDAQTQRWSMGTSIVAANYLGDLVEQSLALKETRLGLGVSVRYQLKYRLGVRAQVQTMQLSGDDRNSDLLIQRGFSFRSNLLHYALSIDYQPFMKRRFDALGYHISNLSPYIVAGMGNTIFETSCKGMKKDNPDVGIKNPKNNFTMHSGIGFRWDKNERFSIAIEGNTYLIQTDYLDGVSLSGKPNNRDWFVTGGISLQYWLGNVPAKMKPVNPLNVH
jgi:opacity protein-like surface antigen